MTATQQQHIPDELRAVPAWLAWLLEDRQGKPAKVPYQARGVRADVWAPAPRLTFDAAATLAADGGFAGVGFVLSAGHDVWALDVDGCRDPQTGDLTPWGQALRERFPSYAEVSPSGTGFKVFARGEKPKGISKLKWSDPTWQAPPGVTKAAGAELFLAGGYCTVTGAPLAGSPSRLVDLGPQLAALIAERQQQHTTTSGTGPLPVWNDALSDDELLALIEGQHAPEFHKLFVSGAEARDDESKLDQRAAYLVARHVGGDVDRIERLLRRSELARPKWDSKRKLRSGAAGTYLQRTIETALLSVAGGRDPTVTATVDAPVVQTLERIYADPEALRPPQAVIPRLAWRGRVTVYAAPDKAGKSTLVTAGVAALTRGQPFLGEPVAPGTAFWAMLEEHVNDLATRAKVFHTAADRLHVLLGPGADPVATLRAALLATRPVPDAVVVDTLIRYAGARVTESGSSGQWRPVMDALRALARELNVAVLVLHHARKTDGQARDSGEITANADVVLEQPARHAERVQRIAARGRWSLADFAVQLTARGDGYELTDSATAIAAAEEDLNRKVWAWVAANPDAGAGAVREGVGGKGEKVDLAVARLEEDARLKNHGSKGRPKWRVTGAKYDDM